MLSRIAENVYWVGRYVERADDTVRLVATHYYGLLQVGTSDDGLLPDDILAVLGNRPGDGTTSLRRAVARCVTDPGNGSSVASCLRAARENARRAREVLPLELWETLSAATRYLDDRGEAAGPDGLLREVPTWTRAIYGLTDQEMARTEAWRLLRIGTLLERADMTLRVLVLAVDTLGGLPEDDPLTVHLWTTALRACGALDAFWARTAGFPNGQAVARTLLRDQTCPRSVLFCLRGIVEQLPDGSPGAVLAAGLARRLTAPGGAEAALGDGGDTGGGRRDSVWLRDLLTGCQGVHEAVTASLDPLEAATAMAAATAAR